MALTLGLALVAGPGLLAAAALAAWLPRHSRPGAGWSLATSPMAMGLLLITGLAVMILFGSLIPDP